MMWPRLNLLRDLLSENGAIVITLDDNDIHRLRELMDEIFGKENFIATCLWQKIYSPKNSAEFFSSDHDCSLIYSKIKKSPGIGSPDPKKVQEGRY
jgi:adenine-specific DNA-methyltransferase